MLLATNWNNRNKYNPSSSESIIRALYAGNKLEFEAALRVAMTYPNARFYSNLPVPTDKVVTHIDVVVIVGSSVLVAEMKSYRSSLSGTLSDKFWLADTGTRKYRILNPLHQNRYHMISLSSALVKKGYSMRKLQFRDYIVVPDGCRLDIPNELNKVILDATSFDNIVSTLHNNNPEVPDDRLIRILDSWRDYSDM